MQDCSNTCCNATSCRLQPNATCAVGDCCDLSTCQVCVVLIYDLEQGSQTRGLRNYFVRPAAMSTNLKIFRIKTTCIIHFTRKKILFVLGPYLLTSTVLSRSRVSKLSVHVLDFSFQLQWEQCCVKQLHFVVRPADWLLSSTAAHMLRWVWDPWFRTTAINLLDAEILGGTFDGGGSSPVGLQDRMTCCSGW